MKKKTNTARKASPSVQPVLLDDLSAVIQEARQQTARAVNSALVLTYWQIDRRIRRAVSDERIAQTLSALLSRIH